MRFGRSSPAATALGEPGRCVVVAPTRLVFFSPDGATADWVRVRKGERVCAGQLLMGPGEEAGGGADHTATFTYAPVAGKVADVALAAGPEGGLCHMVVVEGQPGDGAPTPERLEHPDDPLRLEPQWPAARLQALLRSAGVPLPEPLASGPAGSQQLIVNAIGTEGGIPDEAAAAEPDPQAVVLGAVVLARAAGVETLAIAVEAGSLTHRLLHEAVCTLALQESVQVIAIAPPAPGEVPILMARRVLRAGAGGRPGDGDGAVRWSGAAVAAAAGRAVRDGERWLHRPVLVQHGASRRRQTVEACLGTPVAEVLAAAGVDPSVVGMVLQGGPLRGEALGSLERPITVATSSLVWMTPAEIVRFRPQAPCIRCGRCVDVCPAGLLPMYIARAAAADRMDEAREYGAAACLECGLCAFVCPSHRPLLQWIQLARHPRRRRAATATISRDVSPAGGV